MSFVNDLTFSRDSMSLDHGCYHFRAQSESSFWLDVSHISLESVSQVDSDSVKKVVIRLVDRMGNDHTIQIIGVSADDIANAVNRD